eukprot:TRINITY_DN6729_c0_g1_i3.p1 TRINITY_DN6729_c0_g1~~TRINITY_DN6729_c0_g1_i3.p1  ORF type:complete len:103 (+),score=8.56 TRINITY_DN6729_c0_g1_i3:65-373(+)
MCIRDRYMGIQKELDFMTSDPSIIFLLFQAPHITKSVLETRLADLVSENFGYEDEDIFKSIATNDLQNEPSYQEFSKQLNEAIKKLMQTDPYILIQGGKVTL